MPSVFENTSTSYPYDHYMVIDNKTGEIKQQVLFDCFNYIHNRNDCRIGVNDIDADYWFNELVTSKHANCYVKYSEPNFGSFQNVKVYIEYPNNKIERIEKDGTITSIKKLPWK